jgi:hypothetical protein
MDKPLGPRQPPPDKRHAAYESIFGRPGPSHQQPPYPQYPPQDRRTSYNSYTQPQPPRQSYYPPPYAPQHQGFVPPPHNPALARARSVVSNSTSPDYIPNDSPNHSPAPHPGLTAAQAYQAQVFMNVPNHNNPPQWNSQRVSPAPSVRHLQHPRSNLNGGSHDFPQLGISLEHDDGRLGLDFISANTSTSLDLATDDSSELPWARSEPACAFLPFFLPVPFLLTALNSATFVSTKSKTLFCLGFCTSCTPPSFFLPLTSLHIHRLVDSTPPCRYSCSPFNWFFSPQFLSFAFFRC